MVKTINYERVSRFFDTEAQMLANTTDWPVGTKLSVRGGKEYQIVLSGGSLVTAGGNRVAEIPSVAEVAAAEAILAKTAAEAAQVAADASADLSAISAANAQASALTCATWAVLSGLTGATAGTGAEVLDTDTGAHTDPVVGGTVSNAGRYSWSASPAGWRRIGGTGLSSKVAKSELLTIIQSKNLYIAANKLSGYRINSGDPSYIEPVAGWAVTEFIPVTPGQTYTISANGTKRAGAAFYSSAGGSSYIAGTYNSTTVTSTVSVTMTAPAGAAYLLVNLQSDVYPEPTQVQIEIGATKTAYVAGFAPYYDTMLPAKLPTSAIVSPSQADAMMLAAMRSTIPARVLRYMDDTMVARLIAPKLASPASGTIYVAASNATILPPGNDTTGTGSAAAPYATLTKALSMVPSSGDMVIACDGTFAENNSGAFIIGGDFASPVVIRPHTGATVAITNASGTNGVVRVRNAKARNIQFSGVTIRPDVDGCPVISINPLSTTQSAQGLLFHGCRIVQRSWQAAAAAIDLQSNYPIARVHFVGCTFERVVGANTAVNPIIVKTSGVTAKTHADLGFWDCRTTDAQWTAFSTNLVGFDGVTVARCAFNTSLNHSLLIGVDTSGTGVAATTGVLVYGNDLTATGSNPHGLEMGENVSGLAAVNKIRSGLQGLVVKGTTGVAVVANEIEMLPAVANGSALYPKAASGTILDGNTVIVHDGGVTATGFREGNDGTNLSSGTTLIDNQIEVRGASAIAINWGGAGASSGGATSNGNAIALVGGAALGSVRGATVTTATEMRAAWASAGLSGDASSNDTNSVVGAS